VTSSVGDAPRPLRRWSAVQRGDKQFRVTRAPSCCSPDEAPSYLGAATIIAITATAVRGCKAARAVSRHDQRTGDRTPHGARAAKWQDGRVTAIVDAEEGRRDMMIAPAACVATGVVFAAIGAAKSRWSPRPWWRSGLETLVVGSAAAAVAYAIGAWLRTLIG
jgi:hypothetical protein